jgi:HSP20 family protein
MNRFLSLIPRSSYSPSRDLFDRFFDDWDVPSQFSSENELIPAFDITENDKEYIVKAELPGVDVKDVEITISDGILSVKGEKKHEEEDKGEDYHRIERRFGSFSRSFRIPGKVESDKIDASYKDGVLKVLLPKTEGTEATKIEIK